ncbi:Pentatricopeptide repeat-containing protein At2g31400 [Durusdinium trenchii]|uniref:Chloroplastic n=1 Tax=Durusdinium trenchii TaxID=1381693 RepID=A0ABP0JXK6_9DINO
MAQPTRALRACEKIENGQNAFCWSNALAVLEISRNVADQRAALSTSVINACSKAAEWCRGVQLLHQADGSRVELNLVKFNALLNVKGREWQQVDMWQETMLMLQEMERGMGLRPSLVTRSVAMSACTFVGPWDISLYQMSLVVGGNEVTCSTAISACALGSLWANALSLLGVAITNSWPIRLRSVNDAIAYCGRQKQWQWVLYVLGQLERLRVQGDVITYTSAISACERSQLWKEAFLLFSLTSRTVQANIVTYNAGITALSAKGKWQKTCLLLRELHMQRLAFDAVTCGASVGVCREGGNWEAAFSLLACLDEVHLQSEAIGFSTGIDACGAASEWRKSLVLLQELPWKDAIAHNSAITACGDVAQWQLALQLLKEVDSIGISGAYGASLLFTSAIAACKTCWQHACYLLARMQDIQLQANLFAYNAALGACEQSGRWQEAVLLLKELSEEHLQGDMISFCAGFGACRKTERWEFALPLSKGLRGQLKFLMARAAGAAGAASIR